MSSILYKYLHDVFALVGTLRLCKEVCKIYIIDPLVDRKNKQTEVELRLTQAEAVRLFYLAREDFEK